MSKTSDKIIVALDAPTFEEAEKLTQKLAGVLRHFKIGMALYTQSGPDVVKMVHDQGGQVFLDLKFHDIPSTVSRAVEEAAKLGVWMCNVHASGGLTMMQEAKKAAAGSGMSVIAVTVLTSLENLSELGITATPAEQVVRLASLTQRAGLDGVVCSPLEIRSIREACGKDFRIVTPGVRPVDAGTQDQKRVATPAKALQDGADYLVIGRPITHAPDPASAAQQIAQSVGTGYVL